MKKLNKLFAILIAVLGVTTLKAQTDVTSTYVKNPTFTNKDNWDIKNAGTNNPAASDKCLEFWGGGNSSLYLLAHQEITNLPNGVYRLTINAFNRSAAGQQSNVYVYANTTDKEYSVSMKTRESEKSLYGSEPNSMKDAGAAFYSTKGDYWLNTVDNIIVKDGKLDIGIRNVSQLTVNSGCWTIMGNVKLYELTGASLSPLMNNLITDARNLVAKNYQGASNLEEEILTATSIPESALNYDAIITLQSAIAKYKENSLNSVDATTSTPVDATFLIKNAGFEDGATLKESTANGGYNEPKGWTLTYGSSHTNNHIVVANTSTTHAGYGGVVTPTEGSYTLGGRMRWTNGSNEKITQTVKLPAGSYSLSVDLGFNNTGSCAFIGVIGEKTVFSAKPKATDLTTFTSDKFSVKEGEQLILTFELKQNGSSNTYAAMDNIRLMYYGDPIAALLADITLKKEKLEEFDGKIPTDIYDKYAEHLNAAASANNSMEESALQTILDNLNADIAAAEPLVSPYVNLKSLITTCERYLDNSIEFEDGAAETFSTAVGSAKTNVESATTADAINNIYNTLEAVRQTYVQQADPLNGIAFDYTFLVVNPGLDDGTKGWTSTGGAQNKNIATNKTNGIITGAFFENWNGSNFTGEIYQTISNLPSGIYKLKVAAFGAGTNVYANDKQTAVTTGDGAWYEVDQVKVGDGTLKFGIRNENATTWMGIDNASLEYYGFDVATAQSAITSMVTEAEGLVGKPMNADVASALQVAIDGADATKTTRNELSPMIDALNKAIENAKASIAAYEKLAGYISMTKVFTDVTQHEQKYENGEFATDEVETVRQELNVLRYDAASALFTNKVDVTGWTGTMGERDNEHWSATTVSYKDANSWSDVEPDALTTQITLPKGNYVLKVAGRCSEENATLTLKVLDQTITFHGKGATGKGIDTSGAANFSDGTYANSNNGFGWEWEFLKFSLDAEQTVTLEVNSSYNNTMYVWNSFGDITLWMDDETYLTVNGHAVNAPLADAKALVDTKPMGTAENDALKAAIVLGENVSTAQELDEAIEALETAVANANSWVADYNEKKAPLVAALERFETDYNGATGCLYKLQNAAWANVIEMVKVAAIAKDVTNSYAGFQTAADNLNAALDAAQTSINMYANFAAEISYAKAYTPVVKENTDGHTAAIRAAEDAYKAAEIDDASALIFDMQNYRALDHEHVKGTYTSEVTLGNWSGKTNQSEKGKSEHWSGDANKTYFDYSKWAPEHNNGANEATQTIKLPAGKYVLMAAGRAATVAGTEAYIKVNDTKVNFAAKGAYGYGIATDGTANFAATEDTYVRNNEGYGWEYRFIEFTLEAETEVTLVAGMTIDVNTADLSWASVCTPVLYTTALDAAKQNLQDAITTAQKALGAYPVGDEAFQVSEKSDLYVALKSAIATAQNVLANATTADALTQAIEPLNTAVDNYTNGYVLNKPKADEAFNIVLVYAGWDYNGKAMTYIANDRKDHGLYNIKYKAEPNANYAQAFTFTAVEGKVNHYTLSMTDVDGNERYVCTGVAYGGNTSQIRTTTEADKALAVKVIATSTDGIWNLYNTEAKQYIGSQDEGVFTVNSHINFNLRAAEKANVTLTFSSVGWATLILPFDAELPEDVKAWSCTGANGETLTLTEAESLKANTPYLMNGQEGTHDFTGYGLADKDSYTSGLFTGTYVEYKTTANSNTYVLQKKTIEGKDDVAFYLVGGSAQPTVGAYRCYMTYEAETAAAPAMFSLGRGEGTTGIDNSEFSTQDSAVVYDLMGRRVTTMEKGSMYIVNGKKVVVK